MKLDGVESSEQSGVGGVTPAVGFGIVDVKLKFWFTPLGSLCLMMLTVPQLEMFTGIGAMKSLISAVKDVEERLRTKALPNARPEAG